MKKLLVAVPFSVLLTACGAPSVEDLVEDPKLLIEVSQQCAIKMAEGKDIDTEECRNAIKANQQMAEAMLNGMLEGQMRQFVK